MDALVPTKIDPYTLGVARTKTVLSDEVYTVDFLLDQRAAIIKQRDAELAIVDALLDQCRVVGVEAKSGRSL